MKVGILGTGDVGKSLGKGFLALGHEVKMGARDAANPKAAAFAKENGAQASAGTFAEAAAFGEVIALCTLGLANEEVLQQAGAAHCKGKLVLDATNPLDYSKGLPPGLVRPGGVSGGEQVQRLLPGAKVVKAFNTVGHAHFFKPDFNGGPPDMFICGEDPGAKQWATALIRDFGWGVVDVGGIASSGYLEGMCLVWVIHGFRSSGWNHAFKLLRK